MVLQVRRAVPGRLHSFSALAVALAMLVAACDKAPLLAPGGTVIFLNAASSAVPSTGSVEIVAVLLEQGTTSPGTGGTAGTPTSGGTPVHNGTVVSFTTTLGRVEPAEAKTENGTAKVRFIGDGRSGAATILAYSGGARSEITLNVGAAAAERVLVNATPLGSGGGTSTVTAKVEDTSGNPLPGVTVQFSTTRGTLSSTTATTNSDGVATVTLATTGDATVTATVGTKSATATVTPAARSGLTITAPSTITASSPAQFTFAVATGAAVQNVRVSWGDGQTENLGAISGSNQATHTYASGGGYTVSAAATMTDGATEPAVATSISVGEFAVTVSCTVLAGGTANCQATVTPNTTNVREYSWRVTKSGVETESRTTAGPSTTFSLTPGSGAYTVTVTAVPVVGGPRQSSTTVTT